MRAAVVAGVLLVALRAAANGATVAVPPPAPVAPVAPLLFVRGQILSTSGGYVVFTSGAAVRLASGTPIPVGTTIGSYVRASLDQTTHSVVALELEPRTNVTGEIEVADLPRQYVIASERSIAAPAPSGPTIGALASGLVTVTIDVTVPANTPTSDDVYLATDRSNFSSAEVRMQRVDARTFTVSLALASNTKLRYTFTRGTNATVERDKTGGIPAPRTLIVSPDIVAHESVARWADLV
jgi:hypothetical protein